MTETSRTAAAIDLFALTARAGRGRVVAAVLIDVATVTVPLVLAAIAVAVRADAVAVAFVIVGIVSAVVGVGALARTGQSLGARLLGIRTVERSSASASGRLLLADLVSGRLRAFDLRTGRDPFAAALAPFRFDTIVAPQPRISRSSGRRPAIVALDSGQHLMLAEALLLGRDPSTTDGAVVFRWADLSRTLSKSHARLEWDGATTWATDLGSTNGTSIVSDGATSVLVPFRRTALPAAATLLLGDRTLTVAVPA